MASNLSGIWKRSLMTPSFKTENAGSAMGLWRCSINVAIKAEASSELHSGRSRIQEALWAWKTQMKTKRCWERKWESWVIMRTRKQQWLRGQGRRKHHPWRSASQFGCFWSLGDIWQFGGFLLSQLKWSSQDVVNVRRQLHDQGNRQQNKSTARKRADLNSEWDGFEGCCWRQRKKGFEQSGYEQSHVCF